MYLNKNRLIVIKKIIYLKRVQPLLYCKYFCVFVCFNNHNLTPNNHNYCSKMCVGRKETKFHHYLVILI